MVIAGVTTLAMVAVCAVFSWQVVMDELSGNAQAGAPETTGPPPRDITTREADPEPLTEEEVFPAEEIVINADEPPYALLGTGESEDCTVAAADELAGLIADLDCSQVIRGTLRSPDEDFLVTTGVLNLASEDAAARVYEEIDPLIEDQTGRFVGMLAGPDTEPIMISETRLGWDFRGHYLLYAVVARADGETFSADDDQYAELIIWDMVEVHLRTGVVAERATADRGASTPSPATGDGSG